MTPIFLHILDSGDIYVSADVSYTPAGTILATYRIDSLPKSQKIGTITATAGAVTAVSGGNGKFGKDIL
jgi:hypothetical protein